MRWDAASYGRSFAEVYDDWYGVRGDEAAVVRFLDELVGRPDHSARRRVLELGVGTGRLAVPLAEAGWRVWGLDASADMLQRLARRCAAAGVAVRSLLADAGAGADRSPAWPEVEVVLAAYHFLQNLTDPDAQSACLVAARCAPLLVVEAAVPDPATGPEERTVALPGGIEVRTVRNGTGLVEGTHRGPDGVDRPWRIRLSRPEELDEAAAAAGWAPLGRWEDWHRTPFDPAGSPRHVTVYRRRPLPPSGPAQP